MGFYQYKQTQLIPASIDEVWDFISSPKNLKLITPDYMGFDILTEGLPDKMYAGMIIEYIVTPLLGLKTRWVTEITQTKDKSYFVDEQRLGPYKMWHHQHWIEPNEKGVQMIDTISYIPPFGPIGDIANRIIIRKKLNEIFDYRRSALIERFGPLK